MLGQSNILFEKYKPKKIKDIVGQEEAIKKLYDFVVNYKKQKKKFALVYGPSGTGLTSSIYALASDLNFEIIEVNASDLRNKEKIDLKIKNSLKQKSIFRKEKIILIDEIDCLSIKDRGGLQELMKLGLESKFPIIFTANDIWKRQLDKIRNKAIKIEFKKLKISDIIKILEKIAKKEKLKIKKDILLKIASISGGDARAAINDLQTLAQSKKITEKDLEFLGYREKDKTIFNALQMIFKTKDKHVIEILANLPNTTIDDFFLWLDENLPLEYKKEDLERAYDILSYADIYKRRIAKQQHWRFLIYINLFLTFGISTAKEKANKFFVNYKRPSRPLKIWWAKRKKEKKIEIMKKFAKRTHISEKKAEKNFLLLKIIFKKYRDIGKELRLSKEEIEYLKN